MKCNEPHKNLFSYVEQALGKEERAEVERHLESCLSCREFLAYLSEFPVIINKQVESVEASSFYDRVESRIEAKSVVRPLALRRSILPDLVAASVLAVAIFAGVNLGRLWSGGEVSAAAIQEKTQYLNDMSHEPVESFILTLYSQSHE